MTPTTACARKVGVLAALTLVFVAATGCGGSGYYDEVLGGTLEVVNDPLSVESIERIEISVPFGPIEAYDVLLLPGDGWQIDLFPDSYDVDVYWSDLTVDHLVIDVYDDDFRSVMLLN